ncbi:MAG: glycosyltransferase family 4 protein [Acidobacteria bacterium]|nr:glycosyltransferase family 4 protein [Acidobacteriota bacterium]
MRVAVLRGRYLNPWEMQNFVPLSSAGVRVTAFSSRRTLYSLNGLGVEHQSLPSVSEWIESRGPGFRSLLRRVTGSLEFKYRQLGLVRKLREFQIVHTAETFHIFSYQGVLAKQKWGCKLVTTCWENIPFANEPGPLERRIKKQVQEKSDLFLATSALARRALQAEGVDTDRIRVLFPGVNLERFRPGGKDAELLSRWDLKPADLVILFVGRLVREKGVFTLARALRFLRDDPAMGEQGVRGLLVGDGPERTALEAFLRELALGQRVTIRAGLPYSEMHRVHSLADVFVLPSIPTTQWQEQFGMVLAESMACQKVVVGTECGSIPEVVGEAGVLVPSGDAEALAGALRRLVLHPEVRRELSVASRRRAEMHFCARRFAETLQGYYQELLDHDV